MYTQDMVDTIIQIEKNKQKMKYLDLKELLLSLERQLMLYEFALSFGKFDQLANSYENIKDVVSNKIIPIVDKEIEE